VRSLLIAIFLIVGTVNRGAARATTYGPMQLGVDADNWSGQIADSRFESSLRLLKINFISWHLQPEEEGNLERLHTIVQFCRKNHWPYLFNTEVVNYRREDSQFRHQDGTFRYDLAERTLVELKDDPLFLGVVYDEADLMQAMCGVVYGKGGPIEPYFVDTRKLPPAEAFLAVSAKVAELKRRYEAYGKRLIFEMIFPDYPFAFARGGGLLAPKLLKENYNDLMYAVYRGAALEYHSKELWACVDLWFLDKFPLGAKTGEGYHTPGQLLETLQFAYSAGFDFVYVERFQGLMNENYSLNAYGEIVIDFQHWRDTHRQGNWRTAAVEYYVKRFPDGYWGQDYSTFIPDHPYGSWVGNPYRELDEKWFKTLNELSHGTIPADADTWNATRSPYFSKRPYQASAGLPPIVVFDQFGKIPPRTKATVLDLSPSSASNR
jgi:hypothetical protein